MQRRLLRLLFYAVVASLSGTLACAGGPRYVAGTGYFDPAATGKPVVWANGQVAYYTDRGSLSSSVSQSQANAMVSAAAAIWNAVPTAAVNIASAGSLDEDVNGSNVYADGTNITLPADIQSGDAARPVAIVYDQDGSVINAFFGPGASSGNSCQQNGVFTFIDNLAPAGNIAHALVLINGLCATNAARISVLQYQLVRAFGQVLGLDWSQTNEEMFANSSPTSAGLAGWPIMHPIERLCNASGVTCMPNGTTLRSDDIAILNRLYPVTSANIAGFKNKLLTAANTLSVTGTITFRNGQGMQGVNVVLRPMVPGNDLPDVRYTVTGVSGVYFHGNAGNAVTGLTDAGGNPLARFGSGDTSLEGYFDLSGIPIPPGESVDTWQLSFEPVNPLYTSSTSVGPYATGQVTPSGTLPTIAIPGLAAGSAVIQNVTVGNSADDSLSGNDGLLAAPVTVPPGGEWTARLAGYGHTSWLQWWARANREFTVEVEALDASGNSTLGKAQLVLGMWNGTDNAASAAPVTATPQPFNGAIAGLTTVPVLTLADSEVRLGVADLRGDGRPDYLYRGRVLYAASVQPAILTAAGGPIAITGMGFRPNSVVTVNGAAASVTSVSPTQITAIAPPSGVTGTVPVQVKDPQTLGVAVIADALSYRARNSDTLSLVAAPSGSVPAGAPFAFTVLAANSRSPAAGATVTFTVTQGAASLGCGQNSCSVVTAANGTAALTVAAGSTSPTVVTASLINGATVSTTFTAQSGTATLIAALTPTLYLATGATVEWTPQALILKDGSPLAGTAVTWTPVASGVTAPTTASLSAGNGIATQQLAAGPLNPGVTVPVNACLNTATCAQFDVVSVYPDTAQLQPIAGVAQNLPSPQPFTPITLEVTDPAGDPMAGAIVTFYQTLNAWTPPCSAQATCPPAPLIRQKTVQVTSGVDGSVTLTPLSSQGQPTRLYIAAVTGSSALLNLSLQQHP